MTPEQLSLPIDQALERQTQLAPIERVPKSRRAVSRALLMATVEPQLDFTDPVVDQENETSPVDIPVTIEPPRVALGSRIRRGEPTGNPAATPSRSALPNGNGIDLGNTEYADMLASEREVSGGWGSNRSPVSEENENLPDDRPQIPAEIREKNAKWRADNPDARAKADAYEKQRAKAALRRRKS